MLNENYLKRLALIKYYFGIAIEQSKKSEPFCAYSILTFHDSVELFLQLACEYLNISKSGVQFLEYWALISPEIDGGLTQKESMRRLNSARKELKHNGTLPSRFAIDDFKSSSRNFFIENTKRIFGIEFEDISLIDLIQSQKVKEILNGVIRLTNENKLREALKELAVAFRQLAWECERTKSSKYGMSPYIFGMDWSLPRSDFAYALTATSIFKKGLAKFVDKTRESLISIQDAITILSLGIDYRKYAKFRLFTPMIIGGSNEEPIIETAEMKRIDKLGLTKEDIQFCIDFIIECATILQEFDYSIEE